MRFDVITLFPELFAPFLTQGVTRRAFATGGSIAVHLHQLRDFTTDSYHRVDERPYGGGPGMVLLAEPLERALDALRSARAAEGGAASSGAVPLVLFSPAGRRLTHRVVAEYAADARGAILLCARYEGVDQRFVERHVDDELSLGDFVLSGGEIPALALLDAVARLQPGVLGDALSSAQDSFNPAADGLLDYPHYTRPAVLHPDGDRAEAVPAVLLSGNHAAIARWRRERQLELTARRRPDLIAAARAVGRLNAADESFLAKLGL